MKTEIIPAILVETFEEFEEKVRECEEFAETFQWDIMDGQFVEQMTFNDAAALADFDTTLAIEAHLMVEEPEEWLQDLYNAGVTRVIAHVEGTNDVTKLVRKMKELEFEVGLALNPETPISEIAAVADQLDEVQVMTVHPGASGQEFMANQLNKIKLLRQKYPKLNIGVDGGLNKDTIRQAKEAGANRFGINSAIFNDPDPAMAFEALQSMVNED